MLSQEIFKDLDSEYSQKTDEIINRRHSIHFKTHNRFLDYNGTCFFIPELKKSYILVTRGHTLFDVSSLNHELMHGAEFLLNNGVDQNPKHVLIDELGSLYLEFVTADFLMKEGIDPKEIKSIRQTNYHSNIVDSFQEFYIRYTIMEFLKENQKHIPDITIKDINSLLESHKIKVDNPEEYIVGNVTEGIAYGISYMFANTVYHNYNKKEQLAIIKEVNENPINPFITFEKHHVPITKDEHLKNLKTYVKTLH